MLEKALALQGTCVFEQRVDLRRERGILFPQRREPFAALVDGELQSAVEQRTDGPPAIFVDQHRFVPGLRDMAIGFIPLPACAPSYRKSPKPDTVHLVAAEPG